MLIFIVHLSCMMKNMVPTLTKPDTGPTFRRRRWIEAAIVISGLTWCHQVSPCYHRDQTQPTGS